MAEYISSKRGRQNTSQQQDQQDPQQQSSISSNKLKKSKPLYNGPAAIPNRFHIRPGYRWDAIDRGNGFESVLLKKISSKTSFREDEYKWSVSDM